MVFARRNFQDKLDMINTFRRKEGTKHIFENKETFSNYIQNQVGKDRLQVNKMINIGSAILIARCLNLFTPISNSDINQYKNNWFYLLNSLKTDGFMTNLSKNHGC